MYRSELATTNRTETAPLLARPALALRVLAAVQRWLHNSRTRRQLAQLDGRQLADTGITQADRDAELDKPFWR